MAIQQGQHYRGHPRAPQKFAQPLAKGLGWFSIGLGLTELLAPDAVASLIGLPEKDGRRMMLRSCGVREIAAGMGILSRPRPVGWMRGRVLGDVLDLATLGAIMGVYSAKRSRTAWATAAVFGVTALDLYCSQALSRLPSAKDGRHMTKTVAINRPPDEVYEHWRNSENFATFMRHLQSSPTGDRLHCDVRMPTGLATEKDLAQDVQHEPIVWRCGQGREFVGSVRFERAPGDRGTLVKVDITYAPEGGVTGAALAKLLGKDPGQRVESALRRMKQIIETGGIVHSDASIHDGMHPARPMRRRPERAIVPREPIAPADAPVAAQM